MKENIITSNVNKLREKGKPKPNYLFSNKALKRLIIPLLIEQFLAISVGLADSIMVASVGESAVSAVSLIDNIMILIIYIFGAFATGGAIVAGQALGRKCTKDGCIAVEQTFLFATIFSTVIMIGVYFSKWFILHIVFGKISADVMANCNTYLNIVTLSIPFVAMYNCGAAAYRAMGDSKTPMIMSLIMNIINLTGNAFLLYGLGFGIEGAAIPTTFSRAFAGVVMIALLSNKKKALHIRSYKNLRFNFNCLRKILYLAIPYSVENSMFQLGKILVLSLVSSFGTASIAANAVGNSIGSFAILGGVSVGYALSAVSAQCVGAGDFKQVRFYTKKLLCYAYVALLIMNCFIWSILGLLLNLYNLSPETSKMALVIVLYHGICSIVFWAPSFIIPNTLRAANDVSFCMWVAMISMWTFRIGSSYVLGKYFGLGVLGVWIAMTIDWVARGTCFVARYRGNKWELKTLEHR